MDSFAELPVFNELLGSGDRDILLGTNGPDQLIGLERGDTLTGGAELDQFVYFSLNEAGDIITDFEVGMDQIVLPQLLERVGYGGDDPFADGYLDVSSFQGSAVVRIDSDGSAGSGQPQPFILVQNVTADELVGNLNNFVVSADATTLRKGNPHAVASQNLFNNGREAILVDQSALDPYFELQPLSKLGDAFQILGEPGSPVSLRWQWTERDAQYDNEVGLFFLEDDQGRVDGIAPGEPGYAQAVLKAPTRQVIFNQGEGPGNWQEITLQGGDRLGFYLIQNSSSTEWLTTNPNNQVSQGPLALFSIKGSNPDGFDHVRSENWNNQVWSFKWEDLTGGGDQDFNDVVFSVSPTGWLVPGQSGQTAPLAVEWVTREASYRNEMGYYLVDDAKGKVGDLLPGDAGYAQAALSPSRSQVVFTPDDNGGNRQYQLPSRQYIGWYLIANGSSSDFREKNLDNDLGGDSVAFFSYSQANPDGLSHLHPLQNSQWGWEDLSQNSDQDFDDLIFHFEFGLPTGGQVNKAPTITLENPVNSLEEDTDTSNPIKLADLVINDDELGNNALTLSGDNANFFEISGNELFLKAGVNLDLETQAQYEVTVAVDDLEVGTTPDDAVTYTLSLSDVNEAPTDLGLEVNTIKENVVGAVVGIVTVTDPDLQAAFLNNRVTLSDPRFEVATSNGILQLKLKNGESLDFEAEPTLLLTLTATDSNDPSLTYSNAVCN